MRLLFYRASQGLCFDKFVAWWTRGPYSHVEIQFRADSLAPAGADCFSSSWRDGGTRFKEITFDVGRWVAVDYILQGHLLEIARACDWCVREAGKPYDLWGLLGFGLHLPWQDSEAWYCSEVLAAALGSQGLFPLPKVISPNGLFRRVRDRCDCWGRPYDPASPYSALVLD